MLYFFNLILALENYRKKQFTFLILFYSFFSAFGIFRTWSSRIT